MRLHRFIGNFDLDADALTTFEEDLLQQWRTVLRLKAGDKVILCDGAGHESIATLTFLDKKEGRLTLEKTQSPKREPRKKATLFCAALKRENFELVVQKATEIGIAHIVPLLTTRTVKTGINQLRLEKIIKEASEQSGRTVMPTLSEPVTFAKALALVNPKETVLFDLSGKTISMASITNCFIGPEGGFTEDEVAQAQKKGVAIASLGDLTFRAETAAIIASYSVLN